MFSLPNACEYPQFECTKNILVWADECQCVSMAIGKWEEFSNPTMIRALKTELSADQGMSPCSKPLPTFCGNDRQNLRSNFPEMFSFKFEISSIHLLLNFTSTIQAINDLWLQHGFDFWTFYAIGRALLTGVRT